MLRTNILLVKSFSQVLNWKINLFLKSAGVIKLKVEFVEGKVKVCLSRPYHFKLFKGCLSQILHSNFMDFSVQ